MGEGLSYRPHGSNIDSNEVGEDFPLPVQIRNSSGTELGTNANPIVVQSVSGGDAVTIANGADVCEGATTDAAVTTDANGTLSAKLRGIVKLLAACLPAALGQALVAASTPVVVASDQSAVASKVADGQNVALGTTTDAAVTGSGSLLGIAKRIRDLLSLGASAGSIACELNAGGNYTLAWANPASADADGDAAVTLQARGLNAFRHIVRPQGYNGSTWDRLRAGAAAVLSAFSSTGAQLVTRPGDWSVNHTPNAATQATASKAAGAAGVRHVCTSISATFATIGTAQSAALVLNLRDGATGAGTILWSKQVALPTNAVWEVNLSGLNIVGSSATAMTLEFAGAGAAASFASVSMTGYDCS